MLSSFVKNNPNDKIWWLDNSDRSVGVWIFSFDRIHTYNLFADYPHNLTKKQKKIFDKENPFWADFFADRKVK